MSLKKTAKSLHGTLNFIARKFNPTEDRIRFIDTNRFPYCLTSMARSIVRGEILGGLAGYLVGRVAGVQDEEILSAINMGAQIGAITDMAVNSIRTLALMNMKEKNLYDYESRRRDLLVLLNGTYK